MPLLSHNSHYLEEPELTMPFHKKDLITYGYSNEYISKEIEITFKVSDCEFIKDFCSKIENNIMNNSESTYEIKPVDYNKVLEKIMSEKKEANKMFSNSEYIEAIEMYRVILYDIENHLNKFSENEVVNSSVLREIFEQKKLIYSNLALCYMKRRMYKEAIDLDFFILGLDRKFEKSYVRLISCYIELDNLERANFYGNLMKDIFGDGIVSKHSNIFENLKEMNNKADHNLKAFSKKLIKKESEEIKSEIESEDKSGELVNFSKTNKDGFFSKIFKLFFGSVMIFTSAGIFYYLYRNKQNFMKNN